MREVNHFEPQPAGARVERAQRLIISVTVVPELGRYDEIAPRQRAFVEGSTYPGLVAVVCGSVDQTVAAADRGFDNLRRHNIINLPRAQAELRDAVAVIEGDARNL
jgi:hypothetical protein